MVIGRDTDATWRSLGTLCRERDWSKPRLVHELQNGPPYQTIPPGHTINWRDPNVLSSLDVDASTVTILPVRPANERIDEYGNVIEPRFPITIGVEVMPPTDAPPAPSPPAAAPVKRWRKPPPADKLKPAALAVAKTYHPNNPPNAAAWKEALEAHLGEKVTREVARNALRDWAPTYGVRPDRN